MKKVIFITFLIIITLSSSGQEAENNNNNDNSLSVGINLSPDIAFRTLKSNNSSVDFIKDLRDKSEEPRFGYTAGINLKYNLLRNFLWRLVLNIQIKVMLLKTVN